MKIKAIIAMDKNGTIGNGDALPWAGDASTKWDMDSFKKLTTGHVVLMGYKTYKSLKKPLKNRLNLVTGRFDADTKFYSLKEGKQAIPNDLDLYTSLVADPLKFEYFSNLGNAIKISDPTELKNFLNTYWGLRTHIEYANSNKDNEDSLLVDLRKTSLGNIYSIIPVIKTDEKFIVIESDLLSPESLKKGDLVRELNRLNSSFDIAKSTALAGAAWKRTSGELTEEDEILYKKLNKLDLSEVFIIGGAKTYEKLMPIVDEFYVTEFDTEYSGDVKFNKDILGNFAHKELIEEHPNGKIYKYSM